MTRTLPSRRAALAVALALAAAALIAARVWVPAGAEPGPGDGSNPIVALPGFHVAPFTTGGTSNSKPDSLVAAGHRVYVGYQNATAADDLVRSSTVVEYSVGGRRLRSWSLVGRNDGLRWNPYTKVLWATVNEDGNSSLFTIDPSSEAIKHYTWSAAAHGGGYDDVAFTGGQAFAAASNPTLDASGANTNAAIVSVKLSGSTAIVTPVLAGNASAIDQPTKQPVTLNLTDPDSLNVGAGGDLLLVSQADSEIVTLHKPGTAAQSVSRLPVGTQLDDILPILSLTGRALVADSGRNAVYALSGPFVVGTTYTEAPADSGVNGFVGTVDPATGHVRPAAIGFMSPTGLIAAPPAGEPDGGDGG
ncbi:MAG: hypothetical protein M3024_14660 [Candidatus Dormibacteraeota bacterium]|nr:hypothetical protein [Candidatus Dormibacteraeota bacterium]